mgnify:CR=1 FL=1
MKLSEFDFYLPEEQIAQDPLENRSDSRLMVLNRESGEIEHKIFKDITGYLKKGEL